jgi:hypothetical protein
MSRPACPRFCGLALALALPSARADPADRLVLEHLTHATGANPPAWTLLVARIDRWSFFVFTPT